MAGTPRFFSSLYFHFPFCESKCHYCDFYSLGREKTKIGDAPLFEQAMLKEIKFRGERGELAVPVETIFLGGGTPSMTEAQSHERIFNELFKFAKLTPDYEWTMEANPSSIEFEQFKAYRQIGINRISMGVQSLRNDHLIKLGRVHNEDAALRALDIVFKSGFENVSTDLLCGVPGQTVQDLRKHLETLSAFPLTHLSIYLLTLTKTHSMYKDLPSEEEQLEHLLFIDEFMRGRGFEHYEISNFAKPGRQARHNLVYWTGGSYLSFGPSAHSFSRGTSERFKNFTSLHRYADELIQKNELPVEWTEQLNEDQVELEKWMLALRLDLGFPEAWLVRETQRKKAAHLLATGFLEKHPTRLNHLRATPRGFSMSDTLIRELA